MAGFGGTTLSRRGWAELIAEEAHALGYKMTPRELAEGLGVREAEGNARSGAHEGPWAESQAFGSSQERLNYRSSTRAALKNWAENGKSWWTAWGDYETPEAEGAGPTRYKRHLALATAVLAKHHLTVRAPAATRKREGKSPSMNRPSEPGETSIQEDAMHFALVALLVIGGVVMIGLGTTRLFRSGKAA